MSTIEQVVPATPFGTHVGAQVNIDRVTSPLNLIGIEFNASLLNGNSRFVHTLSIDAAVAPVVLLPSRATIDRCVTSSASVHVLARCNLGMIMIAAWPRSTTVTVASADDSSAESLASMIRERIPTTEGPGTVPLRTWRSARDGEGSASDRAIDVPDWLDIRKNYPPATRNELEQLISIHRPESGGKLILWHGEPGTGKTTALRAILRAWEPWCSGQYIADPEKFFGDPGYIAEVLTRPTPATTGPTFSAAGNPGARWRLIIAEDSDDYLRVTARRDAGASLGRLLNLADGMLGQGFKTLILLTTNEELNRIHPALTRPGRCLARVEFSSFTPAEAAEWLPAGIAPPTRPTPLAEMFELAGDLERIGQIRTNTQPIGQYL